MWGLCGHYSYLDTYIRVIYDQACSLEGTSKHMFEDDIGLACTILGSTGTYLGGLQI